MVTKIGFLITNKGLTGGLLRRNGKALWNFDSYYLISVHKFKQAEYSGTQE